jgi:hypothetical protein
MLRRAFFAAVLLAFPGPMLAAENPVAAPSVGVARMLANGTILVGIRGAEPDGALQAVLMVEPGDSTYQPIIEHVGGLKPGETKSIPPWPDTPPKKDDKPAGPPGDE